MVVNSILNSDNNFNLNITNFAYFTCLDFWIKDNSNLQLTSKIINITGNIYFNWGNLLNINTQYFNCAGDIAINYLYDSLNINPIDTSQPLNIRFARAYNQYQSTVKINGADMVILGGGGGAIGLHGNNNSVILNVNANNIYLDSGSIVFENGSSLKYGGKSSTSYANVNVKSNIDSSGVLLAPGDYTASVFTDKIPKNLKYKTAYTAPIWVSPPNSTSTTVTVTKGSVGLNGSEKYY